MATELGGEMAERILEGLAFTDGVAQSTERGPGGVRVKLTVMPDQLPRAEGGMATIKFPQPVTAAAGELVIVETHWLSAPVPAAPASPEHRGEGPAASSDTARELPPGS